jgi:hypothetical protein
MSEWKPAHTSPIGEEVLVVVDGFRTIGIKHEPHGWRLITSDQGDFSFTSKVPTAWAPLPPLDTSAFEPDIGGDMGKWEA